MYGSVMRERQGDGKGMSKCQFLLGNVTFSSMPGSRPASVTCTLPSCPLHDCVMNMSC